MEKQSSEKRFALLIDADNVSAKYIKPITDELSKYGTVTYKRIYGDWTLTLHAKWKAALLENSLTPIQQFGYTSGKNATDSAMIIDAMDILYTNSVEGFCIVSSDSDFTRLASRIRESGLMVIGMGEKKTPVPFRRACDIFTTLELLVVSDAPSKAGTPKKGGQNQVLSAGEASTDAEVISKEEIEQVVVTIVTDNQNKGKSTGLGEVGSRLVKRYPDFDVRNYGTKLLSKLLAEFSKVQVVKQGNSMVVVLKENGAPSKKAASKKENQPAGQQQEASEGETVSTEVTASDAATLSEEKIAADVDAPKVVKGNLPGRSRRIRASAARVQGKEAGGAEGANKGAQNKSKNSAEKKDPEQNEPQNPEENKGSAQDTLQDSQQQNKPAQGNSKGSAKKKEATQSKSKRSAETKEPIQAERDASATQPERPAPADVEAFIVQTLSAAESEGIALSVLGKRVRAKFRTFKLRDLGYSQFKNYLADLSGVKVEKRDGQFYSRLDR